VNDVAVIFVVISALALLACPRKWAPLPLLVGACYMTYGQAVEIGPFRFTVIRMLIFVGAIRVLVRRERPAGGFTRMDWLMLVWAAWGVCSSAFHKEPGETLVNDLGMVYNNLGIFFLIRCFCQSEEDIVGVIRWIAIVLVPVALEMAFEQATHRNLFAFLGGVDENPAMRDGRLRSQGPFAHAILAGTVGAVCAPLMIGIWRKHPLVAKAGLAGCLLMVITCASSGPVVSLMLSAFALLLWRWRHLTRRMRIAAIVGYILLDLVMKAPAYYLLARIDLAGGSTGWHRAALIESAIQHLGEWWFAGTDYTAHWMPTGVPWSDDHTDITNYYLGLGVRGGLPLMLLFISIMWMGFRNVGQTLRSQADSPLEHQFFVWSLGASLLAHAATAISIAYFDQSVVFIYLTLALTTSLSAVSSAVILEQEAEDSVDQAYSYEGTTLELEPSSNEVTGLSVACPPRERPHGAPLNSPT
jgi:hypothetical protein